jgi:hypothetical protein
MVLWNRISSTRQRHWHAIFVGIWRKVPERRQEVQLRYEILIQKRRSRHHTARSMSDSTCIAETIDAYTGRRIDRKQASCSKF